MHLALIGIVLVLALAGFSTVYAAQHFAIATDIKDLFPRDLPWAQRAYQQVAAVAERRILVVVDAPPAEFAGEASAKLAAALAADQGHFRAVEDAQGGAFFAQ